MIRLVVFDLDGTLVDSLRDLTESANTLLAEYGAAPLPQDRIATMVGDGAAVLVARAFAAAGHAKRDDALARFVSIYSKRLLCHTRPYPGIEDMLRSLSEGHQLAVLTNKPIAATREILAGLELDRYFPAASVVGGDGPHPRKPDPSGLRSLMTGAGVEAGETLLVGDSAIDWRTARAAGTAICLAAYGFGFRTIPLTEVRPTETVIQAAADLLSVL